MSDNLPEAPQGEFILFRSEDGQTHVECRFESDTLQLSQSSICELYGKAKATISEHISNIFTEGELVENSVVRFHRTTADDGKQYNVKYFNLSVILAVGYRVRSVRGTQFRQWATQTLEQNCKHTRFNSTHFLIFRYFWLIMGLFTMPFLYIKMAIVTNTILYFYIMTRNKFIIA